MNVIVDRCHRRARLAAELVEDAWLSNHNDATQAHAAEEMVGECLELHELLKHGWDQIYESLFNEEIDDLDGSYEAISGAVARAIQATNQALKMAKLATDRGFKIEKVTELADRVPKLEELRLEIETNWPKVDEQMMAESGAEYAKGNWKYVEELLRDAQGYGPAAD
jgi:hypothetical protein